MAAADTDVAALLERLEAGKQAAVHAKEYGRAARLKSRIGAVKEAAAAIAKLIEEEDVAVKEEDYCLAQRKQDIRKAAHAQLTYDSEPAPDPQPNPDLDSPDSKVSRGQLAGVLALPPTPSFSSSS